MVVWNIPLIALAGTLVLAALAPVVALRLGRATGYVLAAGYAFVAALVASQVPALARGEVVSSSVAWVPSLGVRFTLTLDALSALFALLVLGVGALVMAYSARYLRLMETHATFYVLLSLFAASMLGLVLAHDLILLFVFWELTSITSFFLIGGTGGGRVQAARAFLVTGLGGLALFAGFVLLGVAAGTFDLGAILADPAAVRDHAFAPAIMGLVLVGAFTKSAQVPFHFWLPGAMVAPTPVSTYLHAATMVKAGIYLLARLSPIFAGEPAWVYTIVLTGGITAVLGAALALKQHDLKALLAYSTVSQLGFITALVGVGTPAALAAAMVHTLAHAAYKATLFMVVGVIDREAGSRDIRVLSGLRRMMPITATITGIAGLSMAGVPPLLGFVSKESAFAAFLDAPGTAWLPPLAAALAVGASVMTFAYGARIFDGAFGGPPRQWLYEPKRSFIAPAAVTAAASIVLGLWVGALDGFVGRAAGVATGGTASAGLALWHGFTPELWLSAATIGVGFTLYLARRSVDRVLFTLEGGLDGARVFDRIQAGVFALGRLAARPFSSGAPGVHVGIATAAALAAGTAAWRISDRPVGPIPASSAADWVVLVVLAMAAFGAARASKRLAAVALLGLAGFLVATLYVLLGAPDLALTQVLVEMLTVTLVVLVFRALPGTFRRVSLARRGVAALAAVVVGATATIVTAGTLGRREPSDAAAFFLEAAPAEAGGRNVVNTILVDFRALDTLGEITVLAVAAIGVYALVRARRGERDR